MTVAGKRTNIPPVLEKKSNRACRLSKTQTILLAGVLVLVCTCSWNLRQTKAFWTPTKLLFAASSVATRSRNESSESRMKENNIPNEVSPPVGVKISNEMNHVKINPAQEWKWQCCVDPLSINPMPTHPYPDGIQDKNYSCPTTPSNFSWYFGPPPTDAKPNVAPASIANYALDKRKWSNASYTFVGGSTTRQMYEQVHWEMPETKSRKNFQMCLDRYMFKHIPVALSGGSHIIDLRQVAPCLEQALTKKQARTNYVIFHLGPWWFSHMVGTVIDEQGFRWSISDGPKDQEWEIVNATILGSNQDAPSPPNVTFAGYIERVVKMMLRLQSPNTVLVYRSESHTDCNPVGSSYRGTVTEVLTKYNIPVLNISRAACLLDKAQRQQAHVCFPSVGLRYWLLQFQRQFLE